MNFKIIGILVLPVVLVAPFVSAEWGNGLGREYKTHLIPLSQQSGWDVETDAHYENSAPAAVVPTKEWVLEGVQFETGSDVLMAGSKDSLDEAIRVLKANPRVRVEIQGHTDNVGDAGFNQTLSEKRALSVKTYLTGKGVDAGRMETRGFGASSPIATNDTAEGRAKNRRIQFKVLSR